MNKKWVCFFSQTGTEINNIRKAIGRDPDLILVNKTDFSNVNEELLADCFDKIVCLQDRPDVEDYLVALEKMGDCVITLHGYLRIIPKVLCEKYTIYNLHPGLITKYPDLKGFNPQERAFKSGYPVAGVVIHEVVPEVDSGKILLTSEVSIEGMSLDEVYGALHACATDAWIKFFNTQLK